MKYYRLLSSLPALPLVPEKPPLRLAQLVAALQDELPPCDLRLAESLILSVDMGNLENRLAGREAPFDSRGLFTNDKLSSRPDSELPEFASELLRRFEEGSLSGRSAIAALWQGYWGYLAELAETSRASFLIQYAGYELPLRNALYRLRAEKLGLDASTERLEEPSGGARHDELVSRLAEEPDAIAREKLLDSARLQAFDSFAGIDPFSIDAVLAYLASALVLDRWDLPRTADAKQLLEVFA